MANINCKQKIYDNNLILTLGYIILEALIYMGLIHINQDIHTFYLSLFGFGIIYFTYYVLFAFEKIAEASMLKIDLNKAVIRIGTSALCGILFFSINYFFIYQVNFENFNGNIGCDLFSQAISFIYFSFVTFSTLGYGDITPNSTIARVFVIEEILYYFIIVIYALSLFGVFKEGFKKSSPFAITNNEEKNE
jgi:hypothetical protein